MDLELMKDLPVPLVLAAIVVYGMQTCSDTVIVTVATVGIIVIAMLRILKNGIEV